MSEGFCSVLLSELKLYVYSEILYNFKYYVHYFSAVQTWDKSLYSAGTESGPSSKSMPVSRTSEVGVSGGS